jgi:hypothetical protein
VVGRRRRVPLPGLICKIVSADGQPIYARDELDCDVIPGEAVISGDRVTVVVWV